MPPRQRRSEHPTPCCRATITQGTIVTLTEWLPWLVEDGPYRELLDDVSQRGIVLADLTIVAGDRGRELIVRFIPDGPGTDEAADALLDWAGTVGHRRVWLPDRVVDVAESLVPAEPVESTCRNCYTTWEDSSASFWLIVRRHGRFPSICIVCGHPLAEWQVADQQFELPADLDELVGVSDSEDFDADQDYAGHAVEEAE
jgi:hypothetical protein